MRIALLLDLNYRQAVDQKRRVEAAILLTCDFRRTINLVHYLIDRIPRSNLFLVENGQKHMASVIQVDLDLRNAVETVQELARLVRRLNVGDNFDHLIELNDAEGMVERVLVMLLQYPLEVLPELLRSLDARFVFPELGLHHIVSRLLFHRAPLEIRRTRNGPAGEVLYELGFELLLVHDRSAFLIFSITRVVSSSDARFRRASSLS